MLVRCQGAIPPPGLAQALLGLIHVLSKVPFNALGEFYFKILFNTRIVHQSHDHHLPGHMTAIDKHNHMAID